MKLIKFDLPIDGVKVATVEELRDHFTTEILGHYRSGLLGKWLRARRLDEQVTAVDAIGPDADDVTALAELCRIFGIDADADTLRAALAPPAGPEGSRLDGAVVRGDVDSFLLQMASLAEVFIDEAVKAVPLSAHGNGRILWTSGTFEAGSFIAWTGQGSDRNTLAPGPGTITDRQVVHTRVKNGEMIGWFQLSDSPDDYAKDLFALRWLIMKRRDIVRDFANALDTMIETGGDQFGLFQAFRNHLGAMAAALEHAMAVVFDAHQAGSVDYLREHLQEPLARTLVFRD